MTFKTKKENIFVLLSITKFEKKIFFSFINLKKISFMIFSKNKK